MGGIYFPNPKTGFCVFVPRARGLFFTPRDISLYTTCITRARTNVRQTDDDDAGSGRKLARRAAHTRCNSKHTNNAKHADDAERGESKVGDRIFSLCFGPLLVSAILPRLCVSAERVTKAAP